MANFNISIGYVECKKQLNGRIHKLFVLDISKFPVLFIDYNYSLPGYEDMDEISSQIMTKCLSFRPKDRVKCVVIDGQGVAYNSIMKPGTYRHDRRDTMMKRINTFVSKIHEEYLKNPDDFVPHTRYVILVCRIGGLEKEIISLMSKLGPIGVYLIVADDAAQFEKFPYLFVNLYGKLTYTNFDSMEDKPEIKYEIDYPHDNELELPNPKHVCVLERLQPYYEESPIIYSDEFYTDFYNKLEAHQTWEEFLHSSPNLNLAQITNN